MSKKLNFYICKCGAGVRLMVREGCLPVRGYEMMTWKYEDDKCVLIETMKHVLFECTLYGEERGRWRGIVRDLKNGMDGCETIKWYRVGREI